MKFFSLFRLFLLMGLPLIGFTVHMATLSDEDKHGLSEAAKDLDGRIYRVRIDCQRGIEPHIMRVHGRSPDAAKSKVQAQLPRCDVVLLDGASEPIWQKALRTLLSSLSFLFTAKA